MKKLLILGAGGHGQVVAEAAMTMNTWSEIYFLDNNEVLKRGLGYLVIGKIDDIKLFSLQEYDAFVAIGNNEFRLALLEELKVLGFQIPVIIHDRAYVSSSAILKEGTCVLPGAVLHTNTVIEEGCIINVNVIVDHNTNIQKGVHLVSGAIVRSQVLIGEQSIIGAGACVKINSQVPSFYQLQELEVYKEEENEAGI